MQISLDYFKPHFHIDKPIRLIELFAGIGSQAKALDKIGADYEKYIISEWEAEATRSYKAIHFPADNTDYSKSLSQQELTEALFGMGISNDGKVPMTKEQIARKNEKWQRDTYNNFKATHNISNICLAAGNDLKIVETDKYCYIMTYSFPCQDLSLAGKRKGMDKGSDTRSSMLWEVERLINECDALPQVLLMENVTQVHCHKNISAFKEWIEFLESKGYSNYYADLNAKNYGIPQNRNRTFMISILGDYYYEFPEPFKLTKKLKDYLEPVVEDKYYLSPKGIEYITNPLRLEKKYTNINADVAVTVTAKGQSNWTGSFISDEVIGSTQENAYRGSLDGVSPTLTTAMGTGGGQVPIIKQVAQLYPASGNPQAGRVYDSDGICCAIDTAQGGNRMPKIIESGDSIDINYPNSSSRSGRILKGKAHTIGCQNNSQVIVDDTYRGREPREYETVAPALRSERIGFKVVDNEPYIVASRGRNPDNPSDRTSDIYLEQRLEANSEGISNCLTSVQKDNLVAEPIAYDEQNAYFRTDGCIGTLTTDGSSPKHNNRIAEISGGVERRYRKLTPLECLLLMAFERTDYEKIKAAGLADTNIYKQAGNSIVVDVLAYIFSMMI